MITKIKKIVAQTWKSGGIIKNVRQFWKIREILLHNINAVIHDTSSNLPVSAEGMFFVNQNLEKPVTNLKS